jgi:hypothetical protein
MKILDPCSATLTLSEVHNFLQNKPAQTPTTKRGAYEPVNLHGYNTMKKDFELYLKRSAPHIPLLPEPEKFIPRLLHRFQEKNIVLTKAEALTLINLGVGVKRPTATQTQPNGTEEVQQSVEIKNEDGTVMEPDDRDDYTVLTAVVEEAENRFSDDQLTEILTILREEMPVTTAKPATLADAFRNGSADFQDRGISVPAASPSPSPEAGGVTTDMEEDAGIDDEAAEDDALLQEEGYVRKQNDGDIDGDD